QPYAQDADPDAKDRTQDAHARGPDDYLTPRLLINAQELKIDPVWHGAEPIPEPFLPIGILDDLAGLLCHVDVSAGAVVHADTPERRKAGVGPGHRPLITLDQRYRRGWRAGHRFGDLHRSLAIDAPNFLAACSRQCAASVFEADPVDRLAAGHLQPHLFRCIRGVEALECFMRPEAHLAPVDGLGNRDALFCPERWERHVHHHHARDEPDGEEDAQEDRKSTRLNSTHVKTPYAVCCMEKQK